MLISLAKAAFGYASWPTSISTGWYMFPLGNNCRNVASVGEGGRTASKLTWVFSALGQERADWKSDIEVPAICTDGFHEIPVARLLDHLQDMAFFVDFKLGRDTLLTYIAELSIPSIVNAARRYNTDCGFVDAWKSVSPQRCVFTPVSTRSYPPSLSIETIEELENIQLCKPLRNIGKQPIGQKHRAPETVNDNSR